MKSPYALWATLTAFRVGIVAYVAMRIGLKVREARAEDRSLN